MNRVLFERPQVEGDAHVHGTPLWLVATLRLASDPMDAGACVAFDLQVSPEEREKFFRNVSRPDDNRSRHGEILSVAYNDFPPSVAAILRKLLALSQKGGRT